MSGCPFRVRLLGNSIALAFLEERLAVDPEDAGGLGAVAARRPQDLSDVDLLELGQRVPARRRLGDRPRPGGRFDPDRGGRNLRSVVPDGGAFERVLQLSDIPRPIMA